MLLPVLVMTNGTALADTLKGLSIISSVTVFPDRPIVTRTSTPEAQSGTHEIEVEGLSMGLLEDALSVTGNRLIYRYP